jgi:molybdopterin-containing oxidoreductase family iron-sulfur binding subunit
MALEKKYWKGFAELTEAPEMDDLRQNEFAEELPTAEFLGNEQLNEGSTSRRDFLKYLGFTTAAASLAACEAPVQKSIPYVVKPDEVIPGVANYYASSFFDGNDFASVLVKVREGRPIKIEPNADAGKWGATNARVQASVLNLYDSARAKGPYNAGTLSAWNSINRKLKTSLGEINTAGQEIALLSSTLSSPSTKALIEEIKAIYPTLKVYTYNAISYNGLMEAHNNAFGVNGLPNVNLASAKAIVGINADFLGEWYNHGNAVGYAEGRDPRKGSMSRHIQFETNMSVTGANADQRTMIKASEEGLAVLALYNALAGKSGAARVNGKNLEYSDRIEAAAADLWSARGNAVVFAGSNDANVQAMVVEINKILGAYDSILNMKDAVMLHRGSTDDLNSLLASIKGGNVGALLMHNVNPAYNSATNFAEAISGVGLKVSMTEKLDETSALCDYVLGLNNYLESWGDVQVTSSTFALQQPTINTLFDTRSFQDILMGLAGMEGGYQNYVKTYWSNNILGGVSWNKALHDGIYTVTAAEQDAGDSTTSSVDLSAVSSAVLGASKSSELELMLYVSTAMGNGDYANNPWLQEMPDPITRASWDNYALVSISDAKEMGIVNENTSNGALNGSYVNLSLNGVTLEKVPVIIQPGQAKGTVGLALGYGRSSVGKAGDGVGVNAWSFFNEQSMAQTGLSLEVADGMHEFACIQLHHTMMGRHIVKETTLADFVKDPKAGNPDITFHTHEGHKPTNEVNLWDEHDKTTGHWWNLSIDLNDCIGCGACVIACQAENNVPVVGKDEIRRARDMHWIRIDRYYSSDMTKERGEEEGLGAIDMYRQMEDPSEAPEVVFQPVMCQHCNHAPCETVCPVAATSHSSEGLNHMAYNRCIGTRYCANNCPYKVRRFNWFNYPTYKKFTGINPTQDDYGRMVLNPDVVVRERGVIEKCSMCIQKIQLGKLEAKKAGRPLKDGEIQTACSSACSTGALVFGDVNDKKSEVAHLRDEPRQYYLLEEVGTQPSVFYQTKVRNKA